MIFVPKSTISIMACAKLFGVLDGITHVSSVNMGMTTNLHFGAIDEDLEPRFPHKIEAIKVPCLQARLFTFSHLLIVELGIDIICNCLKEG